MLGLGVWSRVATPREVWGRKTPELGTKTPELEPPLPASQAHEEWKHFGQGNGKALATTAPGEMQTGTGGDAGAGWEGPGFWLLLEREEGLVASTGPGHLPLPGRRKGLAVPRAGPGLWGRALILFL